MLICRTTSQRGEVGANKTNLTPLLFIESM